MHMEVYERLWSCSLRFFERFGPRYGVSRMSKIFDIGSNTGILDVRNSLLSLCLMYSVMLHLYWVQAVEV